MTQETSRGHREMTCGLAGVSLASSHTKLGVTTLRKKLLYPLLICILPIYFSTDPLESTLTIPLNYNH